MGLSKGRALACAAGLLAATAGANTAEASLIYGIDNDADQQLFAFDSANPSNLINPVSITGMQANEMLVGIDFRPTSGLLYGVGSFGRIYTLNTATGAASFVTSLSNATGGGAITLVGQEFGVDFDPALDRLRIVSDSEQNLRVNVSLVTNNTTVDTGLNPGNPNINAVAYTNNDTNPLTPTQAYYLDSVTNSLYTTANPNGGTVTLVGALGINPTALNGFDVEAGTGVAYAAMKMAPGDTLSRLYTINLATGVATEQPPAGGFIGSSEDEFVLRGIAVAIPEPAAASVLALGVAGALLRRRGR